MRKQYEQQVALLQDKLRWYAENQQLLSENEQLLREQAELISELQAQVTGSHKGSAASRKQVTDLQKQARAALCVRLRCTANSRSGWGQVIQGHSSSVASEAGTRFSSCSTCLGHAVE